MIKSDFIDGVYGMLCFYGVIPLSEVMAICYENGLCKREDFKECVGVIKRDLIKSKKAYLWKNNLCHRGLTSPEIIRNMQEFSYIFKYKAFEKDEYIFFGRMDKFENSYMKELENYFKDISTLSPELIENEVYRLWKALNNADDIISITEECARRLGLGYKKDDIEYTELLVNINKMGNNIPRWFCKGYSYCEAIAMYDRISACS